MTSPRTITLIRYHIGRFSWLPSALTLGRIIFIKKPNKAPPAKATRIIAVIPAFPLCDCIDKAFGEVKAKTPNMIAKMAKNIKALSAANNQVLVLTWRSTSSFFGCSNSWA